jgi:hypothetical protein
MTFSAPGGHLFLAPGEVFNAAEHSREEGCALCKILVESFDDELLAEQRYEIDRSGMPLTLTEWMTDIYLRFRTYWRN